MSMLVRVNEYKRVNDQGKVTIRTTGHGIRIVPSQVVRLYTAGLGWDGDTSHECFTVYLADGKQVITDWAGVQLIDGWVMPS